jgi:3-dehydroquinate synthase
MATIVEMKKVAVQLGENSYEVLIGAGLLGEAGAHLKAMGFTGKAAFVTNPTVNALYGQALRNSLEAAGLATSTFEVPDGEEYKTLASAGELFLKLGKMRAERQTPVVALGGGVIGDVTGFVAATYLRGVPFIQIPTTLLSQIDSSTGGKTAVDMEGLKNRIGAFYQPKLVLADVSTLKTLPSREFASGLAEVIKHAVIKDKEYFNFIEQHIDKIRAQDARALTHIVARSVEIKASYVEQDERDTGIRNVLNLGHTIGHAVESVSGFGLKHGEAVAIGLVAVCELARRLGVLSEGDAGRIKALLQRAGLPVDMPLLDKEKIMDAMGQDKKVHGGRMRFILPHTIGEVAISDDVPPALVREIIGG